MLSGKYVLLLGEDAVNTLLAIRHDSFKKILIESRLRRLPPAVSLKNRFELAADNRGEPLSVAGNSQAREDYT